MKNILLLILSTSWCVFACEPLEPIFIDPDDLKPGYDLVC